MGPVTNMRYGRGINKALPSQSIDSDCLKTGNKERGSPECVSLVKPFLAIGPHFLTKDGPNQLFFTQNDENNNLLFQIEKSLKIVMFVLDFCTKIRLEISLLKQIL